MMLYKSFGIALLLCLASCGGGENNGARLRPVRYQIVRESNGERTRAFSGLAQPAVESKLSFRVPGTIHQLSVKVGDSVKKGEVLARLDPTDYSLQFEEAEASLLQSKAQERHAAAKYARIRELYETRSTSRNELDAARAAAESASAAVDAMQKKLALTRAKVGYTILQAPADGRIADVNAELNENVTTGEPVVILNSGKSLEVKVAVPELYISQIQNGDKARVSFHALPGRSFEGRVLEVGVSSKVGTTFPVTVELSDPPEQINPGMAAEVVFSFPDIREGSVVYVPSGAVEGSNDERYVYVLHSEGSGTGIVEKRRVAVGSLTNQGVEVVSGLSKGEKLITAGIHSLSDGQQVRLIDEQQSR